MNVIIPNKHMDDAHSFYEGHLLESETYVGGHVEALEAGVFRSDINSDFKLDPSAAQEVMTARTREYMYAYISLFIVNRSIGPCTKVYN